MHRVFASKQGVFRALAVPCTIYRWQYIWPITEIVWPVLVFHLTSSQNINSAHTERECAQCFWVRVCMSVCVVDREENRVFASTALAVPCTIDRWQCIWPVTVIVWPVSIFYLTSSQNKKNSTERENVYCVSECVCCRWGREQGVC